MLPIEDGEITIEWWGTAAFRIRYRDWTLLLDPYLTRNPHSNPRIAVTLREAALEADHILVSHGHFDHVWDLPEILRLNPKVQIWGPPTGMRTALKNGCDPARVHSILEGPIHFGGSRQVLADGEIRAEACVSRHVKYDAALVISTAAQMFRSPHKRYITHRLITEYPCGETLCFLIEIAGYRIRFFGSAGPTEEMLRRWARVTDDVALIPLQGHSDICNIGARMVEMLRPRRVIPHHFDDFYPPISRYVDIVPFKRRLAETMPGTEILELEPAQRRVLTRIAPRAGAGARSDARSARIPASTAPAGG